MDVRIGTVTAVYPTTGKAKVTYEDTGSSSLPLSLLAMNHEYSMPQTGEKVVTLHMENGSSKGFVLGSYYGGGTQPKASGGYRKDFTEEAYAVADGGSYTLQAETVEITNGSVTLTVGDSVIIENGSAAVTVGDNVEITNGSVMLTVGDNISITNGSATLTIDTGSITLACSSGSITLAELIQRLESVESAVGL